MVGTGCITLFDVALSTGTAEYHNWGGGIFVNQSKPIQEIATRVTAAQVVIQKNQCWTRTQVSLGYFVGLKIVYGRFESISLEKRKRGLGKSDRFLYQKPVECAIVNMQQWNGREHKSSKQNQ